MPTSNISSSSFNHWLDTFTAGRSTASAFTSEIRDVNDAARHFHGLARQAEQHVANSLTVEPFPSTWEGFMTAHVAGNVASHGGSVISPPSLHRPRFHRIYGNPALSWTLAMLLIVAMAAGVWQASDNTGPPEDDRLRLAAVSEQGATPPATEQVLEGKPVPTASPGAEVVDLPDASDCVIEPLTIDEVLAIVDDPQSQDGTLVNYTRVVLATLGATTGTEGPGYREIMAPPSQETLADVAAVQREWVACTMANSWFQVWALSDPRIVYQDVTERLYPTYITREDARVMLEELQANGTAGNLPLWSETKSNFESVQLVDPDPARSMQIIDPMVEVALRTYDSEGRRVIYSDEDEERHSPAWPNRPVGYTYFTLVWSELEQRWLVFRDGQYARD